MIKTRPFPNEKVIELSEGLQIIQDNIDTDIFDFLIQLIHNNHLIDSRKEGISFEIHPNWLELPVLKVFWTNDWRSIFSLVHELGHAYYDMNPIAGVGDSVLDEFYSSYAEINFGCQLLTSADN